MMKPQCKLIMEGVNDVHAVRHLLVKASINSSTKEGRRIDVHKVGDDKTGGGVDRVLEGMSTEIKSATDQRVAFVVDADDDGQRRWRQMRDRLRQEGVVAPDALPGEGFVGRSEKYRANVGAWIMPDNQSPGAIENWLLSMADHQSSLVELAREATAEARNRGAVFMDTQHNKAVLHAFLAWQEEPGGLYGIAIARGYVRGTSENAQPFLRWIRRLLKSA